MKMEKEEIIAHKKKKFISEVSRKKKSEQKLFHYNSVINLSARIILHHDKKADLLKDKLIFYFMELEEEGYELKDDKFKSSMFYNKHLMPISLYLFDKEKFLTNSDLLLLIIIGVTADFILFSFISGYYYPLLITGLLIFGLYRRNQAKKKGKYTEMFW